MKQNVLQNVTSFILKYIWVFCALLIALELISVTYTSNILLKQSSISVMQSVSGQVSGRVDGVLRLLKGLASDERFNDTSSPLFDRITPALPYQKSYNLYMIGLTDKDVNVVSADETEAPTEPYSLAYRDYMQRLYSTGQYQITDAFISGDKKDTMNYTIAVPIIHDGVVDGSVFGSIYFNDIEEIIDTQSMNNGRKFYLLGSDNTIMSGERGDINGMSFTELSKDSFTFGEDISELDSDIKNGKSGDFWQWDKEGLAYVSFQRVAPTNWTIVYRVKFLCVLSKLLPSMFIKILCYILLCGAVYFFGKRYLSKHLAEVNHLLNRMAVIQKELFQTEQPDYDNIIKLTQQGLTDHLTGLHTRTILFERMSQYLNTQSSFGAVIFIDLDNLKTVNDIYGHEGGDCALLYFGQVLKEYEENYNGIAARYGGDEFIFIINNVEEKDVRDISQKLCQSLSTTITTKEHTFSIHGSLGVSFYPRNGTKPEDLICKADLALYTAKQSGKNCCSFYE